MVRIFIFLLIFTCCFSTGTTGQVQPGPDHDDHHESHEHHRHEIGVANDAIYFIQEKIFSYGFHLHYSYTIPKTKFGIGAGYERIFDEHQHNSIGINAIYQPIEGLHLNLSPGFAFEGSEEFDPRFALHFEISYEFLIGDFHIGPTAAYGFDTEDSHLGLGIHIGYGF